MNTETQVFTKLQRQRQFISSFLLERRLTSQITVRMHGHGEDDNVLGKSQWTPVGHAAQRRTCRKKFTRPPAGAASAAGRSASCRLGAAWRICHRARNGQGARIPSACRPEPLSAQRANVRIKRSASLISLGMCGTTRAAPQHYLRRRGGRHLEGVDAVALLVGVVHEVHGRAVVPAPRTMEDCAPR